MQEFLLKHVEGNQMKIHVVHITSKLQPGGVQRMLLNYGKHIDKKLVVFDYVVQTNLPQMYDEIVKSQGSTIYSVADFTKSKFAFFYDLYKLLKELDHPIIIHSHLNYVNTLTLFTAYLAGVRTRISHSHSNYSTNIVKKVLRTCSHFFFKSVANYRWACSEESGKWLYGPKWSIRDPASRIINNAIDIDEFRFSTERRCKMRQQFKLEDKTVWVHVGSFSEAKNHDFLFRLFAEYLKEDHDAVLLLCGDGAMIKQLKERSVALGIGNSVCFLGNVDSVSDILMGGDLFLLPSKFEGFPMSVVEAQTTGIPCVISSVVPESIVVSNLTKRIESFDIEKWLAVVRKQLIMQLNRETAYLKTRKLGYDVQLEAQKLTSLYCAMID